MGEEQTVLNWAQIIGKMPSTEAESTTTQRVEGVHIYPSESINNTGLCGQTKLEQLVEALPFASSAEDFAAAIEGNPLEIVEDAIALQDTQPRRAQLTQWYAATTAVEETQPIDDSRDDSWIVPFLKDVAENEKFESLKELVHEPEFPLEKLRKLSPRIQEKGASFEPYQRLKLMLDALAGVINIWVDNPYLQMV
jgi:hypothetical protein